MVSTIDIGFLYQEFSVAVELAYSIVNLNIFMDKSWIDKGQLLV